MRLVHIVCFSYLLLCVCVFFCNFLVFTYQCMYALHMLLLLFYFVIRGFFSCCLVFLFPKKNIKTYCRACCWSVVIIILPLSIIYICNIRTNTPYLSSFTRVQYVCMFSSLIFFRIKNIIQGKNAFEKMLQHQSYFLSLYSLSLSLYFPMCMLIFCILWFVRFSS